MTNNEKYLQYTIKFYDTFFKIFGLKPPGKNKSKPSIFYYLYPLIIFTGFFAYNKMMTDNINISSEFHGRKTGLPKLYIDSAYVTSMIMFAFIYFYQNKNIFLINDLHQSAEIVTKKINKKIGGYNNDDFNKGLIKFIIFVIFLNFAYGYGVALKLQLGGKIGVNIIFKGIVYAIPTTIIAVTTDYYCGNMFFITFYFKQLNHYIKNNIVTKANDLIFEVENRIVERKYQYMQEFCMLSDELDELAMLHEELCNIALRFNELWEKQICAYTLWRSYIFLAQLYMEFIFIRFSLAFPNDDYSDWHLHSIVMMFNQIASISKITYCCSGMIFQVTHFPPFFF